MKKLLALTMTVLMVVGLTACSGAAAPNGGVESGGSAPASSSSAVSADSLEAEAVSSSLPEETPSQSKSFVEQEDVLVATSPVQTALQEQTPETDSEHTAALVAYFSWSGNTRTVAEKIQGQTGADIFEITTVNSYSDDYDTVLNEAQTEQRENARPELSGHVENMESYDVVYLGYPNWWGDMPMALYSFLEAYDLSSKTIVPFVTSGGSGFSGTIDAIRGAQPNATVVDGLALDGSSAASSDTQISQWLSGLGLAE